MKKLIISLLAGLLAAAAASAQEKPVAFVNARVIPIVGEPIENGIVLIQNGKIMAVGDARAVRLSAWAVWIRNVEFAARHARPSKTFRLRMCTHLAGRVARQLGRQSRRAHSGARAG